MDAGRREKGCEKEGERCWKERKDVEAGRENASILLASILMGTVKMRENGSIINWRWGQQEEKGRICVQG